mgnify:CR=1 FL=1
MYIDTKTEIIKKRIGENIKSIRQRLNIEVKQLCSELEISPSAYSNIERGVTDINISRLLQLAEYFSVHYSQILSVDNTSVFQFTLQSQANSTQHNINQQAATINTDGNEKALLQANSIIEYLKEQNAQLLQLIVKK